MSRSIPATTRWFVLLAIALAPAAIADDFSVDWYTVDGGGVMWTSGGSFELGGTIGQPDANAATMTGGSFELSGGFWVVPPCWCLSDLNNDGLLDGLDVQGFVDCVLGSGTNCACADIDRNGLLNVTDVDTFVSGLLVGGECP
ncbi:MAG TPA: hypothetical protein VMV94_00680 [Phycisphaerae bacterium]|nr:hypothetical protein [Phycisphaerae bacterium]